MVVDKAEWYLLVAALMVEELLVPLNPPLSPIKGLQERSSTFMATEKHRGT